MNRRTSFLVAALACASVSSTAGAQGAPKLLGAPVRALADETPVQRALAEYRATGRARTILPANDGDFTTYPFGHGRARLRCAALKLCQIDLQPGEVLTDDPLPADRERWDV
ncbi:MAG TPA: hypothetical protein VF625_13110, partial [Longimicrobium sp.]